MKTMVKFSTFLESEKTKEPIDYFNLKRVVIAPGRYNPPTIGHAAMIKELITLGIKLDAEPIIIVVDSGKYGERNPLTGEVRKQVLEKMFPGIRTVVAKNPYEAVMQLKDEGYVPVGGVTGSDRGDSYQKMVQRIFGENMVDYVTHIIGRDPDSDEASTKGVSATAAREAAATGNFSKFRSLMGLKNRDEVLALYDMVRKGMGVQ